MGFAAGLSAGVAAGKAGRAAWEERADKKRDKEISKGLEANAQEDLAAEEYAADLDEYGGPLGEEFDDTGDQVGKPRSVVQRLMADRAVYSQYGDTEGVKGLDAEIKAARRTEVLDNRYSDGLALTAKNREEDNKVSADRYEVTKGLATRREQRDIAALGKEETETENKLTFEDELQAGAFTSSKDGIKRAAELGVPAEFAQQAWRNFRQVGEDEIAFQSKELMRKVDKLGNSGAILDFYNDDDNNVTPGFSLEQSVKDNGNITLTELADEGGEVQWTQEFSSDNEMKSYLRQRAKSNEIAESYIMNMEGKQRTAAIDMYKDDVAFAKDLNTAYEGALETYVENNAGFYRLPEGEQLQVTRKLRAGVETAFGRTLLSKGTSPSSENPEENEPGYDPYLNGGGEAAAAYDPSQGLYDPSSSAKLKQEGIDTRAVEETRVGNISAEAKKYFNDPSVDVRAILDDPDAPKELKEQLIKLQRANSPKAPSGSAFGLGGYDFSRGT
jgi:hypothetical protein